MLHERHAGFSGENLGGESGGPEAGRNDYDSSQSRSSFPREDRVKDNLKLYGEFTGEGDGCQMRIRFLTSFARKAHGHAKGFTAVAMTISEVAASFQRDI